MAFRSSRLLTLVPDSPPSLNSLTTTAPRLAALLRLASRWAGMENPSTSPPPRRACRAVETRKYEMARLGVRPRAVAAAWGARATGGMVGLLLRVGGRFRPYWAAGAAPWPPDDNSECPPVPGPPPLGAESPLSPR